MTETNFTKSVFYLYFLSPSNLFNHMCSVLMLWYVPNYKLNERKTDLDFFLVH